MRIGILGGTFDPIHFGHIRPALEVKSQLALDQVWLMPNHIPPHKDATIVSTEQRLEMVTLVCQEYDEFLLCDIEAKRNSPSYLVTTLETLVATYPQHEFFFLMGTDSLISLPTWFQWRKLFNLCNFVISAREGWELTAEMEVFDEYEQRLTSITSSNTDKTGLIFQVNITPQPYSSTQIRSQIAAHNCPTTALPSQVLNFISSKNLYQTQT